MGLWEVGLGSRVWRGRDIRRDDSRRDDLRARLKLLATGVWEDVHFPDPDGKMVNGTTEFFFFF